MHFSYWEKATFFEDADTVVVGGGLVGLSTAVYLRRFSPSMKVVVVDRHPWCGGASMRNAGFACFGSAGELLDDLASRPEQEVLDLAARRHEGLLNLRELLGDGRIGFDPCGGFELFQPDEREWAEQCLDALGKLNDALHARIGLRPYSSMDPRQAGWPFQRITHAIRNHAEGAVHTGRMMKSLRALALEEGVELLGGLEIRGWDSNGPRPEVHLDGWSFRPRRLVICTNGFARELLPGLDVKPARNQVVVTAPVPGLRLEGTFHMQRGYVYFRAVGERLLMGGFRHLDPETEFTSEEGETPRIQEAIRSCLDSIVLPAFRPPVEYRWSGTMGLGAAKHAIIREVAPNVFCGVRMGGMGVAIGTLVGRELAERISHSG